MALNLDPIQVILQAFASGQGIRAQREALAQRQVEHNDKITQEEKDRKEKVRQFDESQKQQAQQADRMFQLQKILRDINVSQERRHIAGDITEGKVPGNYTVDGPPVAKGLPDQFAVPSQKEAVTFGDITLQPEQWQSPQEFYSNSPALRMQRDLNESRQRNQMALEGFRQTGQMKLQDRAFEHQDTAREDTQAHQKDMFKMEDVLKRDLAGIEATAAMARVNAMSNRADATAERMNRTHADSLIEKFNNAESTRIARKILPDYERMTKYIKDPKSLTSINDIDLVYMAARNFDPGSTVREGEFNAINKNVNNWLEGLGLKLENVIDVTKGKSSLSPAARVRVMRALAPRIQDNLRMYDEYSSSIRNRIEGIVPGYSMHMPDYTSAAMGRKSKGLPPPVEVDEDVFNTYKPKGGK
jgi:hypothetical protein